MTDFPTVEVVLGGPLPPTVWLVVLALAATRLAGLVALDAIFDRPRLAVTEAAARYPPTRWVDVLITCMWCIGVWTGAGMIIVAMATTDLGVAPVFEWCIIGLAVAQVTGMLSNIGRQ